MVHNGIEYSDMQLICEAYQLLTVLGGLTPDRLAEIFAEWNEGELAVVPHRDHRRHPPAEGPGRRPKRFLVDRVLDTAGQKGTGKWTSVNALDMGIPANAIAEAVFARCLSALKEERVAASKMLKGPAPALSRRHGAS